MRSTLALLLSVALLLAPTYAWAQVVVDLQVIPPGRQLTCSGETLRCFTFDEWKQLILADGELASARIEIAALQESIEFLHQQVNALGEINLSLAASNETISVELKRSYEEGDRLSQQVMKLSSPKPGPWIVFVAGLVFMGLGAGLSIGSRK